jgi:hypothetical protein
MKDLFLGGCAMLGYFCGLWIYCETQEARSLFLLVDCAIAKVGVCCIRKRRNDTRPLLYVLYVPASRSIECSVMYTTLYSTLRSAAFSS